MREYANPLIHSMHKTIIEFVPQNPRNDFPITFEMISNVKIPDAAPKMYL